MYMMGFVRLFFNGNDGFGLDVVVFFNEINGFGEDDFLKWK